MLVEKSENGILSMRERERKGRARPLGLAQRDRQKGCAVREASLVGATGRVPTNRDYVRAAVSPVPLFKTGTVDL